MTTDTRPKLVSRTAESSPGREVTLLGHGQGSRDDRPADGHHARSSSLTDAPLWANDLREILADAVDRSFNCLSVEGHASTNDTVLLLSSTAADGADPARR